MPQEFLASFAVDIDEGGVNRLQAILTENKGLATRLAAAFDTARSSMLEFIRSATEELSALPFFSKNNSVEETFGASGTFSVDLDFTKASKQLETFLASAKKRMKLSADGSAIVSAASAALSQVRSMLAGANLTLKVKVETEGEVPTGTKGADKPIGTAASGSPTSSGSPAASASGLFSGSAPVQLSTGGRFSSPTRAEIAEDGDPEYVVPVKKDNEAVPLVRSLLSELSASARESLRDILPPAETGRASDPSASPAPEMLFTAAPGSHPEHSEGAPSVRFGTQQLFATAPVSRETDQLFATAPAARKTDQLFATVPAARETEQLFATAPAAREAKPLFAAAPQPVESDPLFSSAPDVSRYEPLAAAAQRPSETNPLFVSAPGRHPERGEGSPPASFGPEMLFAGTPPAPDASPLSGLADMLSALPELFSAAPAAAAPVVTAPAPQNNVQAPVNIHVEAAAADPEAIGRSIYDTAERYLLRTLQTANCL